MIVNFIKNNLRILLVVLLLIISVFLFLLPKISTTSITIKVSGSTDISVYDSAGSSVVSQNISQTTAISLPNDQIFVVKATSGTNDFLSVVSTLGDSAQLVVDFSNTPANFSEPILASSFDAWGFASNANTLVYQDFHSDRVFRDDLAGNFTWLEVDKDSDKPFVLDSKNNLIYAKTFRNDGDVDGTEAYLTDILYLSPKNKSTKACTYPFVVGYGVVDDQVVVVSNGKFFVCGGQEIVSQTPIVGNTFAIGNSGVLAYTPPTSFDEIVSSNQPSLATISQLFNFKDDNVFLFEEPILGANWSLDGSKLAIIKETGFPLVTDPFGKTLFYLPKIDSSSLSWYEDGVLFNFEDSLWLYNLEHNSAIKVLDAPATRGFRAFNYSQKSGNLLFSVAGMGTFVSYTGDSTLFDLNSTQRANLSKLPHVSEEFLIDYMLSSAGPIFFVKPLGIYNYDWQEAQYNKQLKTNANTAKTLLKSLGFTSSNSDIRIEYPD